MDWTHNGVVCRQFLFLFWYLDEMVPKHALGVQVELFSAISKNGYQLMYLSARAIGQAGYTKEFLRTVRRGTSCLPDGPLFLFPFSLVKAFKK
jgi:phosphatidate phosphatase PAH1